MKVQPFQKKKTFPSPPPTSPLQNLPKKETPLKKLSKKNYPLFLKSPFLSQILSIFTLMYIWGIIKAIIRVICNKKWLLKRGKNKKNYKVIVMNLNLNNLLLVNICLQLLLIKTSRATLSFKQDLSTKHKTIQNKKKKVTKKI